MKGMQKDIRFTVIVKRKWNDAEVYGSRWSWKK
jgi:hypothetical protein